MFCERARLGLTLEDGRFETRPAEPAGYALALATADGGRTLDAELRTPPEDSPPAKAGAEWTTRFELAAAAAKPVVAGTEHVATVVFDGATVERFGCRVVSWTEMGDRRASLVVLRTPTDGTGVAERPARPRWTRRLGRARGVAPAPWWPDLYNAELLGGMPIAIPPLTRLGEFAPMNALQRRIPDRG